MLGDLVYGRERSAVVCIEDTVGQSGLGLLHSFITKLLERLDEVHLICFNPPPENLQSDRLLTHDVYSDTYGWLEMPASLTVNSDLTQHILSHSRISANQRAAIVIDSISPLINEHGAAKSCQIIHSLSKAKLKGDVVQVAFLLHSDLHDDHSLTLIHHVTTSILKISPTQSPDHIGLCNVLHKKSSGKVIKINEHFNINSSFDIVNIQELKPSVLISGDVSEQPPDPTANLTFNLSLTDKEKQARSQLVLPYTKIADRNTPGHIAETSSGDSGGKIFYEMDEADDWDEDDPDDDLDI